MATQRAIRGTVASGTDAMSYVMTVATALTAGRTWILFAVGGATVPLAPLVSGHGLTWASLGEVTVGTERLVAFRGTGTPTSGDVTIDYVAQTQLGCRASLVEVWDDAGGTVTIESTFTNSATSGTAALTLVAGSTSHHVEAFVGTTANTTFTNGTGWTGTKINHTTPARSGWYTWRTWNASGSQTVATFGSVDWVAAGVQMSFAVAGTPVGQASEADTAQPVAAQLRGTVAQASEADTAQSIAAQLRGVIAQASEVDTAQPIAGRLLGSLGQVSETDTAQVVTPSTGGIPVGQASEADTAQPVIGRLAGTVAQAVEVDTAQVISGRLIGSLARAVETDTAQVIAANLRAAIAQASEVDIAQVVVASLRSILAQAVEVDSAQLVSVPSVPSIRHDSSATLTRQEGASTL